MYSVVNWWFVSIKVIFFLVIVKVIFFFLICLKWFGKLVVGVDFIFCW